MSPSAWPVQQVTEISFSWSHWAFKLQIYIKHYYYLWFIYVTNSYHRQINRFEIDKILWTFQFLHTFGIGDIQDRSCNADRPIYYVANSENNWKYFSRELVQPKTFCPSQVFSFEIVLVEFLVRFFNVFRSNSGIRNRLLYVSVFFQISYSSWFLRSRNFGRIHWDFRFFLNFWNRMIDTYSMNRIWWNFNWAEFQWINGNFSFGVLSYLVHTVCGISANPRKIPKLNLTIFWYTFKCKN